MKHLLLFVCTILLLAGCRDDNSDKKTVIEGQRTVIVYMSAENNLADNARRDIEEMLFGCKELDNLQHLVVFLDDERSTHPVIMELKNGVCDTVVTYDNDFYASDPERFGEILSTIIEKFPAKSYGLVLWGHAKGWLVEKDSVAQSASSRRFNAYGIDTGSNLSLPYTFGSRWMNISQMVKALEPLPYFDFIFADCCCMMCVETAYELRHKAHYLIGSPSEIPANGAPYDTIVPLMFSTADDFYVDIIDTYYDAYLNVSSYNNSLPLSTVDLHQMDSLAEATRAVLKAPDDYDVTRLAYYYQDKDELPVMYDMVSLMERNLDASNYAEWLKVFNKAVPYRRFSKRWMTDIMVFDVYKSFSTSLFSVDNFGGLSMFVPLHDYVYCRNYDFNNDIKKTGWYKAVDWSRFE